MSNKKLDKVPVSAYVLTYNNRRTIEKCLTSLHWAEEVVVVDSFSTDGTFDICRRYTEHVFQRKWQGHKDQYQYAADLATKDWIMFVDADEEISEELAVEIGQEVAKEEKPFDGFIAYRRTYFLDRWIRHGGWYPDCEIRLYRRDKGRWEGGLHAKVVVDGRVGSLKNEYLHYTYRDISDQIQTIDRYSAIAVEDIVRSDRSFRLLHLLFNPPFRFFKDYVLKFGFLDGIPGFIIAVSTAYYAFIKHAKLWEYHLPLRKGEEN